MASPCPAELSTSHLSLLNTALLNNLSSNEKRRILETEFNIEITPELEKGVDDMCNLSAGIEKNAREEERKKAILETEARAKDMIRDRMDLSLVEKYTRLPLPRIKELAHGLDML